MTRVIEISASSMTAVQNCLSNKCGDMTVKTLEGKTIFIFHGSHDPKKMEARASMYERCLKNADEILCCYSALLPDKHKSKVSLDTLDNNRVNVTHKQVGGRHYLRVVNYTLTPALFIDPHHSTEEEELDARTQFLRQFHLWDDLTGFSVSLNGKVSLGHLQREIRSMYSIRPQLKLWKKVMENYEGPPLWVFLSSMDRRSKAKVEFFKQYLPYVEIIEDFSLAIARENP